MQIGNINKRPMGRTTGKTGGIISVGLCILMFYYQEFSIPDWNNVSGHDRVKRQLSVSSDSKLLDDDIREEAKVILRPRKPPRPKSEVLLNQQGGDNRRTKRYSAFGVSTPNYYAIQFLHCPLEVLFPVSSNYDKTKLKQKPAAAARLNRAGNAGGPLSIRFFFGKFNNPRYKLMCSCTFRATRLLENPKPTLSQNNQERDHTPLCTKDIASMCLKVCEEIRESNRA